MALALRFAAPLSPEAILAQAISEFEHALSAEQKAVFRAQRSHALRPGSAPQPQDVMRFTAELNLRTKGRSVARCFGQRFTSVLQTAQQYAALGDIVVGASQNILAAGIWSLIRLSLQAVVGLTAYLERISIFFMEIGRSAPRYQSMALLYPQSATLRGSLCHYFAVVTKVCRHFVSFSQKSMIGQLASSLDESMLRAAQAELEKWSRCITDEVGFLGTQTIENEARENSSFRALLRLSRASESHRHQLRRRTQLLDSCSEINFESHWNQIRQLGESTIFVGNDAYRDWKTGIGPPTLVLMGILGSGKSVTMANIVDDLLLSDKDAATIYFFCGRDNGLTARAIVGCLVRQLLRMCIHDSAMDDLIDDFRLHPSLEYMTGIVTKVFPRSCRIWCLVDGIDECTTSEALQVLGWVRQLRADLSLQCCVSVRSTAHQGLVTESNLGEWATIRMPEDNPDILNYINAQIEHQMAIGELKVGDPDLRVEIGNALIRGAKGMFLWVALQIRSLCEEESDEAIRCAIEDLPEDLNAMFERVLSRSRKGRREYQGTILKLVSAAHRPLTLDELREAISITPHDLEWHQGRLVNDVRVTIGCCGGLVMVDEVELSVRLIHHSVRQFVFDRSHERDNPSPWRFTAEEADMLMGEIALTYLSLSVFEKQISSTVVPEMHGERLADNVINSAIAPTGVAGKLARKLLRRTSAPAAQTRRRNSRINLARTFADAAWNRYQRQNEVGIFHFLPYATRYWLSHTSWVERGSPIYNLWMTACYSPKFDIVTWTRERIPPGSNDLLTASIMSPVIAWSIYNNHLALLRFEMTGMRWARGFASVKRFLVWCRAQERQPALSSQMATKLLRFAVLFRSAASARWLVSSIGADVSADEHDIFRLAISTQAYHVLDALLHVAQADTDTEDQVLAALRFCVDAADVDGLNLVLRRRSVDIHVNLQLGTGQTLLQAGLKAQWRNHEELRKIVDTVTALLDLGADPNVFGGGESEHERHCTELLLDLSRTFMAHFIAHVIVPEPMEGLASDIEATLERMLRLQEPKEPRPEWLRFAMETYLNVSQHPAQSSSTTCNSVQVGDENSAYDHAQQLARTVDWAKRHCTKIVEILLSHRHIGDRTNLTKLVGEGRRPEQSLKGVMRYLLEWHRFDMSTVPKEVEGEPPLALQAALLGRNFLPVVRMILFNDMDNGRYSWVWEVDALLAKTESKEAREILTKAFQQARSTMSAIRFGGSDGSEE